MRKARFSVFAAALVLVGSLYSSRAFAEYPVVEDYKDLITSVSPVDMQVAALPEMDPPQALVVWALLDTATWTRSLHAQRISLVDGSRIDDPIILSSPDGETVNPRPDYDGTASVIAEKPVYFSVVANPEHNNYAIAWTAEYWAKRTGDVGFGNYGYEVFGRTVSAETGGTSSVRLLSNVTSGIDDQTLVGKHALSNARPTIAVDPTSDDFFLAWGASYLGNAGVFAVPISSTTFLPDATKSKTVWFDDADWNADDFPINLHYDIDTWGGGWLFTWRAYRATGFDAFKKRTKRDGGLVSGETLESKHDIAPVYPSVVHGENRFVFYNEYDSYKIEREGFDTNGLTLSGMSSTVEWNRLLYSKRTELFHAFQRVRSETGFFNKLRIFDGINSGADQDTFPETPRAVVDESAVMNAKPGAVLPLGDGLQYLALTSNRSDDMSTQANRIQLARLNVHWADFGVVFEEASASTTAGSDFEAALNVSSSLLSELSSLENRGFGGRVTFSFDKEGVSISNAEGCATFDATEQVCTLPEPYMAGDSNLLALKLVADPAIIVSSDTVTLTATIESDSHDPNADNDEKTLTINVTPSADLSLAMTAPEKAEVGKAFAVKLDVANAGPGTAEGARVSLRVPDGATFVNANGCTAEMNGAFAECGMGDIAKDGATSVTFNLKQAAASSAVELRAGVASASSDPAADNNHATGSIMITAAAGGDTGDGGDGGDGDDDGDGGDGGDPDLPVGGSGGGGSLGWLLLAGLALTVQRGSLFRR